MRRKLMPLLTWIVIAGLVAACAGAPASAPGSPGGGTTNPPAAGAPEAAIDACTVLTDAEIEAATGQHVTQRTASTLTQVFPSVCDIDLDGGGTMTVSVKSTGGRELWECCFEPLIGEDDFAPLDEAVAGIGDKAGRSGDGQLMVLEGDVLFDILYIEFARNDKRTLVQYLAERVLARLGCIAAGCPQMSPPPTPIPAPATPSATKPAIDPGNLPSTGALARVVNLYSENGQPVAVDVYAHAWSATEMGQVGALVATVPYGEASEWFNPGLVESPFSSEPSTSIEIFRAGDQSTPLAGVAEFLGPGTVTTIAVWQEEVFEGSPGAWVQAIYAEHPTYPVPQVPAGQALLVSNNAGLKAEKQPPVLYASVGDGCLESPVGRWDPAIPNAQPLGNDLVLPVGEHSLTLHDAPVGELATCQSEPFGPGTPLAVTAGERWLAFPYRLDSSAEVSLLVIPFSTQ